MQSPTVSIGVPVYNGAGDLQESLDCLLRQTHGDYQVLLSDNASTDGTSEICAAMAAKDSRFTHVLHGTNLGVSGNFRYALTEAPASDLFMWRAHDDVTSDDYLARLVALHANDPDTRLAVGRVETRKGTYEGDIFSVQKRAIPPFMSNAKHLAAYYARLFHLHESSFYGVWKRDYLVDAFDGLAALYPHAWALDHLTLMHVSLDSAVRADPQAVFIQRLFRYDASPDPDARLDEDQVAERCEQRRLAAVAYDHLLAHHELTGLQRKALAALRETWLDKRVYKEGRGSRSGLAGAISQMNRARKRAGRSRKLPRKTR